MKLVAIFMESIGCPRRTPSSPAGRRAGEPSREPAALGVHPDVVAMDGEVSNSTFADEFAKAYPERYFEMFIAEQQMVAAAAEMPGSGTPAELLGASGIDAAHIAEAARRLTI